MTVVCVKVPQIKCVKLGSLAEVTKRELDVL